MEQCEGEEKEQGVAKEQQTTLTESFPKVSLKKKTPRITLVQGPTPGLPKHETQNLPSSPSVSSKNSL